jgi:hypothetical protein
MGTARRVLICIRPLLQSYAHRCKVDAQHTPTVGNTNLTRVHGPASGAIRQSLIRLRDSVAEQLDHTTFVVQSLTVADASHIAKLISRYSKVVANIKKHKDEN